MSGLETGAPGTAALGEADAAAAVAELRAQLRLDGTGEEALLRGFVDAAAGSCELFTGQVLLARPVREVRAASAAWTRLGGSPVRAITGVSLVPSAGEPTALPAQAFAVDIDEHGDGWVRLAGGAGGMMLVGYEAGLAVGWDLLPAPLRTGALRLAAHLYAGREGREPPVAVSALWRPFRRMPFGRAHDRPFGGAQDRHPR